MPTVSGARATDLAWAAGLMVGEGSVGFYARRLRLKMNMCDQRAMYRFAELFGTRAHKYKYLQLNGRRAQYGVSIYGSNAARALAKMWPYMEGSDKARQTARAARKSKHFDLMLSEVSANPVRSRATDVAWAAGLVVGEGCVYAHPRRPRLLIKVRMNDKQAVRRFAELFDARVYRTLERREGCVPIGYGSDCNNSRAIAALAEMWPYMECSDKADQAIAAARKAGVYDKLMEEIRRCV